MVGTGGGLCSKRSAWSWTPCGAPRARWPAVAVLAARPAAVLDPGWTEAPPAASALPPPSAVHAADVLTWRRAAVVATVAVALPLAVALTAAIG